MRSARDESLPSPEVRDSALTLVRKAEQDEMILAKLLGDPEVADEALGFHVQQAVEKRLKAVLVFNEVDFKHIHNIGYLTALLEQNQVDLPTSRGEIDALTSWAVDARYEDFFEGALDRPAVPGLIDSVVGWSNGLIGATNWLSGSAQLLQLIAREGTYDHVGLLVEREREAFVIHVTVDGSVWVGSTDELQVALVVHALDQKDREVVSVVSQAQPKTMADGLALIATEALEGMGAKQVVLLVRSGNNFSFMWWHVNSERTLTGDDPPDLLSGVLLDLDRIAANPLSGGEFEKPDPDVRFSAGVTYMMTEDERVALEEQLEAFREKFGREPEPEDPVFFDPEADRPTAMSKEKVDRIAALAEEFGAIEYSKRMAAAKVRAGMVRRTDADEPAPYDEVNPVPMLLVLAQAAEIEGDLQSLCMYAAVHAWAEGHLAVPGHPDPTATETPLHVPPFPDPADDGERLAAVVAVAQERFDDSGSKMAAIVLAAALAWEWGWKQGLECEGCAIEGADSPFSRAMRRGELAVGFSPILRAQEPDPAG
jgi:HEPN domain-containing protein